MTLTAQILPATYQVAKIQEPREVRFYTTVFRSCFEWADNDGKADLSDNYGRRLMSGDLRISNKLLTCYHDDNDPRFPERLYGDIESIVDYIYNSNNLLRPLRQALVECVNELPEDDRAELIANVILSIPTIASTSTLWCRVLAYAMAMDHSSFWKHHT